MNLDSVTTFQFFIALATLTLGEAFFLRWGSDNSQSNTPKTWVPAQTYRAYAYPQQAYLDQRKLYQQSYSSAAQPVDAMQQMQQQVYSQLQPIPISVPLQASLTPVSLQHVQLVPCMCPIAAEEADKLHDLSVPGPYLAQTAYASPNIQQQTIEQPAPTKS